MTKTTVSKSGFKALDVLATVPALERVAGVAPLAAQAREAREHLSGVAPRPNHAERLAAYLAADRELAMALDPLVECRDEAWDDNSRQLSLYLDGKRVGIV